MTPPAANAEGADFLAASLARLEDAVDAETASLRAGASSFADASDVKRQTLLTLTQAMRRQPQAFAHQAMTARMRRLRHKLAANARLLQFHLEAVRDMAALLSQAIAHENSDGTYTLASHRARRGHD